MSYGIYLWADLDRERRVGGSRPNQNDYVFVILVTHHKCFIKNDPYLIAHKFGKC